MKLPRAKMLASAWTRLCIRADKNAFARMYSFLPSPPLPSPPLPPIPCGRRLLSARTSCVRVCTDAQILFFESFLNFILFIGSCCRLEKRKKNFGFQFSIPKIPRIPKLPKLHERSRDKKKVFSA
jgi:hypothetical protein